MEDRKAIVLRKLERVREELLALVGDVDEAAWERSVFSESDEWLVSDLFRHIVDAEAGMTGLIKNIRDGGTGVPPDFDLVRWNASQVKKTKEKSIDDLTADLVKNRAKLLNVVETLEEEDWDKKGRHASLIIMTIEEVLHRIADHESEHTEDIRRALA